MEENSERNTSCVVKMSYWVCEGPRKEGKQWNSFEKNTVVRTTVCLFTARQKLFAKMSSARRKGVQQQQQHDDKLHNHVQKETSVEYKDVNDTDEILCVFSVSSTTHIDRVKIKKTAAQCTKRTWKQKHIPGRQ